MQADPLGPGCWASANHVAWGCIQPHVRTVQFGPGFQLEQRDVGGPCLHKIWGSSTQPTPPACLSPVDAIQARMSKATLCP